MKRKEPVSSGVLRNLYPFAGEKTNPPSWGNYVRHKLMPELQCDIRMFYGEEACSSLEMRYPGLDYTSPSHRRRLGRWSHHHELFKAFDQLGLTDHEIKELCNWEGTLFAKEKFERQHGVKIHDTTGDCVKSWDETSKADVELFSKEEVIGADEEHVAQPKDDVDMRDTFNCEADDADEDQGEIQSIGYGLNEHLLAVAAAREQGHLDVSFDIEWETWLKDMQESGEFAFLMPPQVS